MSDAALPGDEGVGEELALRVVSAAHRRRVRRFVVAGLVAVTLGGGVAVAVTHRSGAGANFVASPQAARSDVDARPAIYAAALRRYAQQQVIVDASSIPTRQRAAVRALAGGSTRFATAPAARRDSPVLVLGRLTVSGHRAQLEVGLDCGPLCGHGEALSLSYGLRGWQVVGARMTWLS
jgi:hypothetical protein